MVRVNRHHNWTCDNWPEPYRSAWMAAVKPGDAYSPGGRASTLSPRTRWNNERAFGRYLEFRAAKGRRDTFHLPDLDNLRAYDHHLRETLAPYSVIANLTQVTGALRAMFPDADLQYINQVVSRLIATVRTVRPVAERLIDPITLIQIGTNIVQIIEQRETRHRFDAEWFRDGTLIISCANLPLRLGNWQRMIIDKHISLESGRVTFTATEMKGRRSFEATLTPVALAWIKKYVSKYRPLLLDAGVIDQGYLFPACDGGPTHRNTLGRGVKTSIRRHTGRIFGIHMFRHCVATFMSETSPQSSRAIKGVLHHSGMKVADKHYIKGAKRLSFKSFQGAVREIVGRARRRKARAVQRNSSVPRKQPARRKNG